MKNNFTVSVVCWQTRNIRRHRQAVTYSKNYGLHPLTANLWIGTLRAGERVAISGFFQKTFTKKTEKFHFFTLCKDCYAKAMFDHLEKGDLSYPQFEIIG